MCELLDKSWHWQAIDPSRNIARDYHLRVATDLFGWTTVERRWGRIGSRGQSITMAFDNGGDAELTVKRILQRRQSAVHRIGVGYRELR